MAAMQLGKWYNEVVYDVIWYRRVEVVMRCCYYREDFIMTVVVTTEFECYLTVFKDMTECLFLTTQLTTVIQASP